VCRPWSTPTLRGEHDKWTAALYPPESKPIVDAVEELAKKKGVTMAQIALAWALSKDAVSAPVVGTTSLKNLEELISKCSQYDVLLIHANNVTEAVHIKLTDEEVVLLEAGYKPQGVKGHW
jgi:hypothetical protein